MPNNTPPQAPRLFNYTPESITNTIDDLTTQLRAVADQVVAEVTVEDATFDNTVRPMLQAQNELYPGAYSLRFMLYVHPDAAIREASAKMEEKMDDLEVELAMRQDIFDRVNAVYQRRESAGLDPESLHTLDKVYKQFTDAGLLLPVGPSRDRFKDIQLELNRLCAEGRGNINSETGGIFFTPEELAGIPQDTLNPAGLEKGTGENENKVKVGFKDNVYEPLMAHATRAETRRDYYIASQNKVRTHARQEQIWLLATFTSISMSMSSYMLWRPLTSRGFSSA